MPRRRRQAIRPEVPREDDIEQIQNAAMYESMLEDLINRQDPWAFVTEIHEQRVPHTYRQMFLGQFVSLVSQRPITEQEALVEQGRSVFKYRVETIRKQLEALRAGGAGATKIQPFVLSDDMMAEIIYDHEFPHVKYLVYKHATGETEKTTQWQVGDTLYMPPQTKLVEMGTILLPTGVEEYGDNDALFNDIRRFINEYLFIRDPDYVSIMAYYIMLTWIYDRFDVVPYLRAQGTFGTGKTRVLQTAGALGYRTINAGGATTAAPIFRIIERFKGTLVIDEADFSESDLWSEVVKILNTGYMRGFPVLRAERGGSNEAFDVMAYDCYGPKILSTRKRFSDQALESRCLSHTMSQLPVPEHIPLFLGPEFRQAAQVLRNKLLLWRFRTYRTAEADPRQRFKGLDARLNQIILPLLASCNDQSAMRESIVKHAQKYQEVLRADKQSSYEGQVAAALLQRWRRRQHPENVLFKQVVEAAKNALEEQNANYKVSSQGISNVIYHTFDLHPLKRGGQAWIVVPEARMREIAEAYALPFDNEQDSNSPPTPPSEQPPSPILEEGPPSIAIVLPPLNLTAPTETNGHVRREAIRVRQAIRLDVPPASDN